MRTDPPRISHAWSADSDQKEAGGAYPGRLVSYSLPVTNIQPVDFLRYAEGYPRFFWQQGNGDETYAGFGMAVQLMAWGENRFDEIRKKARSLFDSTAVLGQLEIPIRPRLFGGFAFSNHFAPDITWAAFHPAHFVLPHYQLLRRGDNTWLTINAFVDVSEDLAHVSEQLKQALMARHEVLLAAQKRPRSPEQKTGLTMHYPMSTTAWKHLVGEALQQMVSPALNKVVLARVCELRSSDHIEILQALTFLDDNFAGCTRFLFEPRPYHSFFGATPELLVKTEEDKITTMALAGSMPRGTNHDEDFQNSQRLLNSAKERNEHQLVVDAIRKRLDPITSQLFVPSQPLVYQLSYIQHLLTPISGVLSDVNADILHLVELLHPTPAMGGSPRERALAFIEENEPVPRGWYASPVGWLDSAMHGEFAVAIRSAVAQERRVWCYAGAGIVPDSKPEVEWQETDLKFRPMLRALGAA